MSLAKGHVRIELELEAEQVAAIDAYVLRHPGSDRGAVIGEALRLWLDHRLELEMERQLRADSVRSDAELTDWRRVQDAAARRHL